MKLIDDGFSTVNLLITIIIIGILSSLLIPNFLNSIEFIEVLITEKKLYEALRECQLDLVSGNNEPTYSFPINNVSIGFSRKVGFVFSNTGVGGRCINESLPNLLRASRVTYNNQNSYSLTINLLTGERTISGDNPDWFDWWKGIYSPLIPKDDPVLYKF